MIFTTDHTPTDYSIHVLAGGNVKSVELNFKNTRTSCPLSVGHFNITTGVRYVVGLFSGFQEKAKKWKARPRCNKIYLLHTPAE
jgi:hypothetical protein